ncbi:MAG: hypothetical protein HYX60_04500 [Legionella longbeachae]|nr:hypothetical protein [Legionella longbeachae]
MFDKYYRKAKYVFKNLKELGLSTHCQRVRSELIMLVTNNDIMSERLSSKLMPSAWGTPYQINKDDSEQVLVLKKNS